MSSMSLGILIDAQAPVGSAVTSYDQRQLALYAALLDAHDAGQPWQEVARAVMGLEGGDPAAEACWRSHLERARWIVGDGLGSALVAFGAPHPA